MGVLTYLGNCSLLLKKPGEVPGFHVRSEIPHKQRSSCLLPFLLHIMCMQSTKGPLIVAQKLNLQAPLLSFFGCASFCLLAQERVFRVFRALKRAEVSRPNFGLNDKQPQKIRFRGAKTAMRFFCITIPQKHHTSKDQ